MEQPGYLRSTVLSILLGLGFTGSFGQGHQRIFFGPLLTVRDQRFDFSDDGGKIDPNSGRRLTYGFTLGYYPTKKFFIQTGLQRNTFSDDIHFADDLLRTRSNPYVAAAIPVHFGWQPLSDAGFSMQVFGGITANWLEGASGGIGGGSFQVISSGVTILDHSYQAQTTIGTRRFTTLDFGFSFGVDLSRRLRGYLSYTRNFGLGKDITSVAATYTRTEGTTILGPFQATVTNDGDASQWSVGVQYMVGPDLEPQHRRVQKADTGYHRKKNAKVVRLVSLGIINPSVEWERPLSRFTTLSI